MDNMVNRKWNSNYTIVFRVPDSQKHNWPKAATSIIARVASPMYLQSHGKIRVPGGK